MVSITECKTRPVQIQAILSGLDRYNPEATSVLQDYVAKQCKDKSFDAYANLALLKLYQFNPPLINMEITINILTKALTVFPSSAFSLSLSLLPPYTQPFSTSTAKSSQNPLPVQIAEFVESVQKLTLLNTLLESAQYEAFWSALNGDDIYADLIADVAGFEDLIRIRIAVEVGKVYRDIKTHTIMQWLAIKNADEVVKFVQSVGSWSVDGEGESGVLKIPANKENEVRSEVRNEKVGVEQFGRVIRRGFEQHI